MSTKRLDLQGVRGLAILAVLGFHFYPNLVPNGYLGVDQFFVLSGFLMCMLLSKGSQRIVDFYIRRLKRILPLYQLLILISTISLYFLFPVTAIEINTRAAERAILFVSNRLITVEENYMQMLSHAINIFTHTWSLSVEVQFYLLVPFIYLLPFKNISFTLISIASFLYFNFLPPDEAFVSVLGRIWQFLIGMIAFLAQSSPIEEKYTLLADEEEDESSIDYIGLGLGLGLVVIPFCPLTWSALWIRPIITIFTATFIATSSGDNILLSNRVITYLGDISYSLYLIHWPIYSYWKLNRDNDQMELIGFLMLSVIISISIYETFEKWYTQSSTITCFILTILFTSASLAILHKEDIFKKKPVEDMRTLDDAARLNAKWTIQDDDNLCVPTCKYMESSEKKEWCNQTGLNPSNKYKIMILGNSYAANHGRIIYEECSKKAKSMWQQHMFRCEPLYNTLDGVGVFNCNDSFPDTLAHLKSYKPDYAFHITRYIYNGDPIIGEDPIYQTMLNNTRQYLKHIAKKLYILNALPRIHMDRVQEIVLQMRNNTVLEEIDEWLMDEQEELYLNARKRYIRLVKDCGPKCELIDYYDLFHRNDTNTFRFYDDKGFSYLTGFMHLSPHGLEYVRHVYTDICNKM